MKDETARRICQWTPMWSAYIAINLVLLVLLLVSLVYIEWSFNSGPFVMTVMGLVVVIGGITIIGGTVLWCRQYRGVQTVEEARSEQHERSE